MLAYIDHGLPAWAFVILLPLCMWGTVFLAAAIVTLTRRAR